MSNGQYPSQREGELYCNETIAPDTKEFPENGISTALLAQIWHMNSYDVLQPGGRTPTFRTDLEPEDVKLVNELGRLSPDQLMEYIRQMQSSAFSLGIEESKQFSKAKVLQIFKQRDT